jgi:hypothetical protein
LREHAALPEKLGIVVSSPVSSERNVLESGISASLRESAFHRTEIFLQQLRGKPSHSTTFPTEDTGTPSWFVQMT